MDLLNEKREQPVEKSKGKKNCAYITNIVNYRCYRNREF